MQRVEVILQFSIIAENKAQVPAWQSGDPEFSTCSDKKSQFHSVTSSYFDGEKYCWSNQFSTNILENAKTDLVYAKTQEYFRTKVEFKK
jgi:hypothetical protein